MKKKRTRTVFNLLTEDNETGYLGSKRLLMFHIFRVQRKEKTSTNVPRL